MFLQNIFITETNNYTKRILQSHTDHYPNISVTKWKKLITEELNRSIACHRSTQTKHKSHNAVTQNTSQHCPWFHNISKTQFPIKPDMFSHGSQERSCYCPGCLLEVSGFHHTSTNLSLEKNTCICWIGGRVGQTASLDTVEKRKIPCPYQHSKHWHTNYGLFPNWLCYPSSYSNQ